MIDASHIATGIRRDSYGAEDAEALPVLERVIVSNAMETTATTSDPHNKGLPNVNADDGGTGRKGNSGSPYAVRLKISSGTLPIVISLNSSRICWGSRL